MNNLFNENDNVMQTIKQNENFVVFSSLSEFYHPIKSNGFAVKYVVDGVEKYVINGERYDVKKDKYLLTNYHLEGHVEIESNKNVKGICINIMPEILTEVVASFQRPDTAISDLSLGEFFSTNRFLEGQYDAKSTNLGKILGNLALNAQNNFTSKDDFGQAFFLSIIRNNHCGPSTDFQAITSHSEHKICYKKRFIQTYFFGQRIHRKLLFSSPHNRKDCQRILYVGVPFFSIIQDSFRYFT